MEDSISETHLLRSQISSFVGNIYEYQFLRYLYKDRPSYNRGLFSYANMLRLFLNLNEEICYRAHWKGLNTSKMHFESKQINMICSKLCN